MKQYITEDQLNELSEESLDRLGRWAIEWVHKHPGEKIKWLRRDGKSALLSIGQMIEFLSKRKKWSIGRLMKDLDGWWIYLDRERPAKSSDGSTHTHRELCGALWQAVKEVLEMI